MQLVIDTAQTKITVKDKSFYISNKTIKRQISPKRISSIAITSNALISAKAMILASENEVPIYYFDNLGQVKAKVWSPYFKSLASLRKRQWSLMEESYAVRFSIANLKLKIQVQEAIAGRCCLKNQMSQQKLQQYLETSRAVSDQLTTYLSSHSSMRSLRHPILGLEGQLSRQYWLLLGGELSPPFNFKNRSRRPAKDFFNSAINYLYGMTYTVVEQGITSTGLDQHAGFFHTENYRKTSLVFDLIEPFRPFIDELLVTLIRQGLLNKSCFTKDLKGVKVNSTGKKVLIPAFNDHINSRVTFTNRRGRLKDHIYRYCADLALNIKNQSV